MWSYSVRGPGGKPKRWSDWDFVVVVSGENDWQFTDSVRAIMSEIDLDYDVFTQTQVVSEYELKHTTARYEPIYVKALTQGIYA